jgi:hypothetical protein
VQTDAGSGIRRVDGAMSDDGDPRQWWLVYIRWPSGKRETIRTTRPDVVQLFHAEVCASLPEPRILALQGVDLRHVNLARG